MLEYAGSQRSGLQAHRGEGLALVAVLRSLDWLLLAGVGARSWASGSGPSPA